MRYISEIARDIMKHWKNPYFGAVPYIKAMGELRLISDRYFDDSANDIINYFLVNASTWRGPEAREIKKELKSLLKSAK